MKRLHTVLLFAPLSVFVAILLHSSRNPPTFDDISETIPMKNILVTGGVGFIGTLARLLLMD